MTETRKKMHYSWVIVIGAAMVMFATQAGVANTIGIYFSTLNQERGFSLASLGLYYTFQSGVMTVMQPVVRKLYYKYDARLVGFGSIFLMSVGYMLFAAWPAVWGWWISGVIIGVGVSFTAYLMAPLLMNNWFHTKYSTAVGVACCAQGLGGFIWSLLLGQLLPTAGYKACYLIIGAASLVIGGAGALLFRRDPAEKGLFPYGINSQEELELSRKANSPLNLPGVGLKDALKSGAFWMMLVALILIWFGCNMQTQMTNLAYSIGFSITNATTVSALVFLGNIPGRFLIGYLTDKWGVRTGFSYGIICGIVAFVLVLASSVSPAFVYIGAFLFGNFFSLITVGSALIIPRVCGRKDLGQIQSYVASVSTVIGAIASTIFGYIYDMSGSYATLIKLGIAAFAVALVLVWIIWGVTRNKPWNKITN